MGCAIATLAMLTARSYAAVRAEIDAEDDHGHDGDWSSNGISHVAIDRYLIRRGLFLQRRYPSTIPWEPWPPEPFAPLHFASIVQPSGNTHFVVMDRDGVVLDPMREGAFRLTDWPGVNNVCGILRPHRSGFMRPAAALPSREETS